MFVTCNNDLEELQGLMPDAGTRISDIQIAAFQSISNNSKVMDEAMKAEFKPTNCFQGRNGEVFSGMSTYAGGPRVLHVPSDEKTDDLGRFNPFAFGSPATPVRIGSVPETANDLDDQGWTVNYIQKPPLGQASLRKDDAFRTICAAKESENGDVENFLMAGRSRLGEEGGGTSNYHAWEYSKKGKDGSIQTFAGSGASATQINSVRDYVSNYSGVSQRPEWRHHAVARVQETGIEEESERNDIGPVLSGPETFVGSLVPGAWPENEL
jgi:hypothetical protein